MSAVRSEFVVLFRSTEPGVQSAMATPERRQESLKGWLAWIRELEDGGHLKNPGRPLEASGKVIRGAGAVVTDGPYVESKELILGFLTIEAENIDQAVELTRSCPIVQGGGSVEIRPLGRLPR